MTLFLIGYRGSGKTTIGRQLAERLGRRFIDLDEQIVRHAGKSIKDIFDRHGEPAFRDLESATLRDCAQLPDHVIALGGGTLQREGNRQFLAGAHQVIYLRCHPGKLLARIQSDPASAQARPNLTHMGGSLAEIEALLSEREPVYRAAATAELDVTDLSPAQAVQSIIAMIK